MPRAPVVLAYKQRRSITIVQGQGVSINIAVNIL